MAILGLHNFLFASLYCGICICHVLSVFFPLYWSLLCASVVLCSILLVRFIPESCPKEWVNFLLLNWYSWMSGQSFIGRWFKYQALELVNTCSSMKEFISHHGHYTHTGTKCRWESLEVSEIWKEDGKRTRIREGYWVKTKLSESNWCMVSSRWYNPYRVFWENIW